MKDPHNYQNRLEGAIRRLEATDISKRNKELILRFKDDCLLQISTGRTLRYVQLLTKIAKWLGIDLDKAEIDDLKKIVTEVNSMDYSEWTRQFYRVTLRKFYSWLKEEDNPKLTSWISATVKMNNKKLPEDLLTVEEIEKLINTATNPRDRAFIATLYESGCRVGELLQLKIKNVTFDQYGAKLMVNGKTGARRIRIVTSTTYLSEWINKHPLKGDNESQLWVTLRDAKDLWYGGVRLMISNLKIRAGINKRIYPHLFRHSRATHLANHLTEAQMKEFFGWTQSSNMASVYVHLSGRDVDSALLKTYGIKINGSEEEKEKFRTKHCMRCEEVNPPTNSYCIKCGLPLDKDTLLGLITKGKTRSKTDNILDKLLEDDEFRKIMEAKIKLLS